MSAATASSAAAAATTLPRELQRGLREEDLGAIISSFFILPI
jgi:hypothetical protein